MLWECNTVLMSKLRNDALRNYDPDRAEKETLEQMLARHSTIASMDIPMDILPVHDEYMAAIGRALADNLDRIMVDLVTRGSCAVHIAGRPLTFGQLQDAIELLDESQHG
jgi:hypothetical protein